LHYIVYDTRATKLVAANVTNPIIFPGDINYNFSSVWSSWNGANLFTTGVIQASTTQDVGSCLYFCATDSTTPYPYAGISKGL
jgi:hypothetical protein